VLADLRGLPPLLLQVGSTELLLDDARRVNEKMRRAGGVSVLEVFEGLFHGWQMFDGFNAGGTGRLAAGGSVRE